MQTFTLSDLVSLVPPDWRVKYAVITGDQWPRISDSEMDRLLSMKTSHTSIESICPNCGLKQKYSTYKLNQASNILLNPTNNNVNHPNIPYSFGTEVMIFCTKLDDKSFVNPLSFISKVSKSNSFVLKNIPVLSSLSRYPIEISSILLENGQTMLQSPVEFKIKPRKSNIFRYKQNKNFLASQYNSSIARSDLYGFTMTLPTEDLSLMRIDLQKAWYYKVHKYYEIKNHIHNFPVLWRPPKHFLIPTEIYL